MTTPTIEQLRTQVTDVVDRHGDKIGSLDQVYLDDETGQPAWVSVNTGMFGLSSSLAPLHGAEIRDGVLWLDVSQDAVADAPNIRTDHALTEDEERTLYHHYGLEYTAYEREPEVEPEPEPRPHPGTPHQPAPTPADEAEVVTSEEQLEIDKRERERGRVRLRKYVVTDEAEVTVPVRKEVAHVEREPADGTEATTLTEDEAEVVLSEEEVEVGKRTVPKERVRVDTETVTDEERVREEVAHEEVEVDKDVPERRVTD